MKLTWNNKWIIVLLLLLVAGNAIFTGILWKRMHQPPHQDLSVPPNRGNVMSKILHFDSSQKKQFREISTKHFARMDTLKSMEYMLREKLFAIIDSGKLDTSQMHVLSGQLAKVQQQIQEQNVFHFSQVMGISRPEQKVKLKEMIHGSVMRDMGPAKFLQAMPKELRDSLLEVHPDMRRPDNPRRPIHTHNPPMMDDEQMFPPPQDHPGPPPPGRPRRPHRPPPPEDEMFPPEHDRPE